MGFANFCRDNQQELWPQQRGEPARAFQHELDHLDGVTMLDRISRLKKKRYIKKIPKIMRRLRDEAEELYV